MIFRQIVHEDLGCASYLIGDERIGAAAVVDPQLEIDVYLEIARYMGVSIEHIFETHNHADHVSGHGRLAAATGAAIHIHREAAPAYDHAPLGDGDEIALGAVVVRALHTPGHRPEHTAFQLIDTRRGPEPWAVLTGDSLFVGDVARPDLAVERSNGARGIFRSLRSRLLVLDPAVEVWPGHLGGSMCGGPSMDMKVSSTIGFELAHNPALQVADEDAFVAELLAKLGPQPPNFRRIVELNCGELVAERTEGPSLEPRQIQEASDGGALVVDVRPDEEFDDGHIPGAVSITMLRAGFGSRLAWIANPEQAVVFVGGDGTDGRRAGSLAHSVGVLRRDGYLRGGMTSWRRERRPVERVERTAVGELVTRLRADPDLQLLDVRDPGEWAAGHVPGSILVTWRDNTALPGGLDPERPVAVICGSGQRAAIAASLLRRFGAGHVIHVVGGGVPALGRAGIALAKAP